MVIFMGLVVKLYWLCWHISCFAILLWEKYLTGVLYLPWGYDISQVVSRIFKEKSATSVIFIGLVVKHCIGYG